MFPIITSLVLLLAIFCHLISQLVAVTPIDRGAKFFHILTENPTVTQSNTKSRSSVECGYQCLLISGCTGYSFISGTGCTFYSSVMQPAGLGALSPIAVYTLDNTASCFEHDQFELMELDGSKYCVRIFSDATVDGIIARSMCQSLGANVIALETRNKIDDFRNILTNRSVYTNSGYWVGLYDLDVEGQFAWEKDGIIINDANEAWDSGQPNGLEPGQGDQDCGFLEKTRYIQDKACTTMTALYACEIDLT